MKSAILFMSLLISQSVFAVGQYECSGGPYALSIAVRSEYQLIINGFEAGEIDWPYARSHPVSKMHRLVGNFATLGGGWVYVSKSIFNGARTARVTRIRRGANTTETHNYVCTRS